MPEITKYRYYKVIQDIRHPFMLLDKNTVLIYKTYDTVVYFTNNRTDKEDYFQIQTILRNTDFFEEISKEEAEKTLGKLK